LTFLADFSATFGAAPYIQTTKNALIAGSFDFPRKADLSRE
jgi:hypothetical protein